MMLRTCLAGGVILLSAVAGCYTGGAAIDGAVGAPGRSPAANGVAETGNALAPTVTGLPCDVAAVIANECATCHGAQLTSGAPNRLLSYEDLMAVTGTGGDRTVAQVTLERMRDARDPMPPTGASPADVAVISAWIAAGMPAGTCESSVEAPITTEYDTALVCTSKQSWTGGEHKSPLMHPGAACISCHDSERKAPSLELAGTVYPTAHEPDDCNGFDGTLDAAGKKITTVVEITDATGKVFRARVNSVGNFYVESTNGSIKMPYTAKVIAGTRTRIMKDPVDTGDCNTCHTVKGAEKAPGRVMAP